MTAARSDADNLRRLEGLKATHERLRTERIRNDDAIERHQAEYEAAKARAEELLGTSDEAELRRIIEQMRVQNTRQVDEYEAELLGAQSRLSDLERTPA